MAAAGRRVLLVSENLPLARDTTLEKQAGSLVEAGLDVTVVCPRHPGNHRVPGVHVLDYRAPAGTGSRLGFVREYAWALAAGALLMLRAAASPGFDVVQVSGTPGIYFLVTWPYRLLGRRVVVDQRELTPELFAARYGRTRGVALRVLHGLERVDWRAADHVVTVNRSLQQAVTTRGGIADDAVTVVLYGPRLAHVDGRRADPSLRHGRRHLACFAGCMEPQDSVALAVRMVAVLVHDLGRTDCHFAFLGDGECRAECERLASALGVGDYVSFPGRLDEAEVFAYLATADVGIDPNLEDIVSPVKAMEYMAFGVPVVAFAVRETLALVGGAGAYAPAGDVAGLATAVDRLLADPDQRRLLAAEGRRRVREWVAWERQAPGYVSVFDRLLTRRRPASRGAA